MFKTTDNDTLKQDKKCQPCRYIVLSTMSGSTTASDGLRHEIRFEKQHEKPDSSNKYNNNSNNDNQVSALVTFERGGRLKARFTFELSSEENYNSQKQKKIQSIHIQFIE
jgi:hypothetical protein